MRTLANGKIRVQIDKLKVRASRVFTSKREAAEWAAIQEHEIVSKHGRYEKLRQKIGFSKTDHSADEIISGMVKAPTSAGIYILFSDGEVVYVGQSKNVLARISAHANNGRKFTHYFAMPFLEHELDERERYYINLLKPLENKTDRDKF